MLHLLSLFFLITRHLKLSGSMLRQKNQTILDRKVKKATKLIPSINASNVLFQ